MFKNIKNFLHNLDLGVFAQQNFRREIYIYQGTIFDS